MIMGPRRSLARRTKDWTQRNSLEDRGEVRTGRPSQRLVLLKQARGDMTEGWSHPHREGEKGQTGSPLDS